MSSSCWLAIAAAVLLDHPRIVAGQDYPAVSPTYWNSSTTSSQASSGVLSSSPASSSSTAQSSSSILSSTTTSSHVPTPSSYISSQFSSSYASSSLSITTSSRSSQLSSTSTTAQGMGELIMGGLGQATSSTFSLPTISASYIITNSSSDHASSYASSSIPTFSASSLAFAKSSGHTGSSSAIPTLSASSIVHSNFSFQSHNYTASSSIHAFSTSGLASSRLASTTHNDTHLHSFHSHHSSAASSHAHSHHPSAISASHPIVTPTASLHISHHRNFTSNYTSVTGCQAELASWSKKSSDIVQSSYVWYQTSKGWYTSTETIEYGHAKNRHKHRVTDGVTHFDWAWEVTSTTLFPATWSYDWNFTNTSPFPTTMTDIPPKPTCTIDPSSCAALWSNYQTFLGMSGNNTIIEADKTSYAQVHPEVSPRCTQGGTTARCLTRRAHRANSKCAIAADSVKVYFWPHQSTTKPSHTSPTITPPPRVISTFGINMTSPSVYLHFDNLGAATNGIEWIECENSTSGHYYWWASTIGKTATKKQWFSVRPDALSTMEKIIDYPRLNAESLAALHSRVPGITSAEYVDFPDQALEAMYKTNATDYSFWAEMIYSASGFRPTKVRHLTQLTQPDPRAYYLRPFADLRQPDRYARGCHPQGPHPGCNTIFDLKYRAQVSFPEDIGELNTKWRSCEPWVFGVYDPPVALSETDSIFVPDATTSDGGMTAIPATPVPGANQPTVPATTTTTPTPTAQPDQLTSPTQGSGAQSSPAGADGESPVNSQPSQPQNGATNVNDPPSGTDNTPVPGSGASLTISFSTTVLPAPTAQSVTFSNTPNDPASPTQSNDGVAVLVQPDGNGGVITQVLPNGNGGALTQLPNGNGDVSTQPQQNGNGGASAPVAVITAGGSTLTAASSDGVVVFGTQTLLSGQATILSGDTILNAGTAMIVNPASTPSTAAVAVITADGNTLTASSGAGGAIVIGSTTIAAGQAATIGAQIVSNNGAAVVVSPSNAAANNEAGATQTNPLATVAGQIIAQDGTSGVVVDGFKTVQPGQQVTLDGTVVSVGSSFMVVGTNTVPLAQAASAAITPLATVGGQLITPDTQAQGVVIGGSTLLAGQQTTISGTVVSVGTDAVVIGSSTMRLPAAATPAQNAAIETVSGSLMLNLGSTTIPLPGSDSALTAAGVHTATLAISRSPSITVAGSSIITAGPGGQFVIGGQTLSPGGNAAVISGTTYSLGPSDSYLVINGKTTSIAKPGVSNVVEIYTISTSSAVANKETASAKAAVPTSLPPLPGTASARADASLLVLSLGVLTLACGFVFL